MSTTNYRDVRKPLMNFLQLAPTTSGFQSTVASPQKTVEKPTISRRTSSLSSTSSASGSGLRFLKLGPVQNGEHPDDCKGDFHEVAVVE